jgi:hypothetical protein
MPLAPASLSEDEAARRLPVWVALSRVFLDTELTPSDYHAIATAINEADFPKDEARSIFTGEVAPAFAANLHVVAGEWAGWPDDYVRERVLAKRGSVVAKALNRLFDQRLLAEEWAKIAACLDR